MEIFLLFEAWKCDFAESWNPRSRVPTFVWANFPHFGELKMTFLPKVSWLVCRKFDFSRVVITTFHEQVSIFSVFWRAIKISVYWLELDGLLTETGRSVDVNWMLSACIRLLTETRRCVDGNWMIYWRKVDNLFTETAHSIDGNCTVYLWKLDGLLMEVDGLLTETGRSIDGKSAVYWWKQSSRFSSFWGPENAIFAEF